MIEKIVSLRESGLSWAEIASKLGFKTSDIPRNRYYRWRKSKGRSGSSPKTLSTPGPDDVSPKEMRNWLSKDNYHYFPDTDVFVTFLSQTPKPVVVPGDVHRNMLRAYSNWNGDPSTINEICRQFGFPRPWFVEYKKIHGWTHDLEPFTKEEMLDEAYPEAQKVEDLLAMKRASLYKKWERTEWQRIRDDADKWRKFETYTLNSLIEVLKESAPKYEPPRVIYFNTEPSDRVLVISTADAHLGKRAWEQETGDHYDLNTAAEILIDRTRRVIELASNFEPKKIIFCVGSDYLHVDNTNKSTENGTPQDVDGSFAEIVMKAGDTAIKIVDMLRGLAPVDIVMASGNHDRIHSWNVLLLLRAWFTAQKAEDVNVIVSPAFRQYILHGKVLMGFTHGDGPKKKGLGMLMAQEAREEWARAEHHIWFTGHLHHEQVSDIEGVVVYQLPSISGADRWHAKMGYTTAKRALAGYIVDPEDGVIAQLSAPVK